MDKLPQNIQTGHGKRGCKPFEYGIYDPKYIYLSCKICDFNWKIRVSEYMLDPPTICPLCHETRLYGAYIMHDQQLYEGRIIPYLHERRLDIRVSESGMIFGDQGLYIVDIYPHDKPNAIKPELTKLVYLDDPINLENNQYYNENILKVYIDDSRAWKRARIYIYRVVDAIQDDI